MGWIVCPVNTVRASHSAVDLRTCTDATNLCSECTGVLVGGLMRIFVLKRFGALMNICDITRSGELLVTRARSWGCACCPAPVFEMVSPGCWVLQVFVFFPRRIASGPAFLGCYTVTMYRVCTVAS